MNDTEPSSKRAEANRRNARKSTGPKTAAGKERARFNAVKHGMRAKTVILPGEDTDAFQARMVAWTNDLKPADDVERFLVARAVQLSWQLERADRALAARDADARAAGAGRIDDLADEVAALGRRLFWDPRGPTFFYPQFEITLGDPKRVSWSGLIDDPDDPLRLVNRLEATAMGCAWLLDRWGELRDVLEQGQKWGAPDRFKAIRLLGRQPLDMDEDGRVMAIYLSCSAMEPPEGLAFKDLGNELHWNEQKRFNEWAGRRGVLGKIPADAEAGKAALLELVSEEEYRLEELLATLLERPLPSSDAASEFDASDVGERLRRYQATCDRTLLRVLETLRKRRKDAGGSGSQGRRSARPTRTGEETPDPLRGLAGLLSVVAAARGAGAKNGTGGPGDLFGRGPADLARPADVAGAPPVEPSPDDPARPCPPDASPAATNEPNEPAVAPVRSARSLPAVVLAVLALLACAGFTAAFGRDTGLTRQGGDPSRRASQGISTHASTQTSSPLTSQRNRCTEFPLTDMQRPSESRNRHR
jgi:hypothetical protein